MPHLFAIRPERGQALTEYAFLLLFVVLVVILILAVFGEQVLAFYEYLIDTLPFS